jgi:menaquinone-specific isochorismate synthase
VKDYAFLKTDSGQMVCGFGPFTSRDRSPGEGVAFYVNDFELSDPEPWKIPAEWSMAPDLGRVRAAVNGAGSQRPRIEWEIPGEAGFHAVYDDIMREIAAGRLAKSVPVLTERGVLAGGEIDALLPALDDLPAALFGYGCRFGDAGMLGATPELLMAVHGRHLETMALAGTTPAEQAAAFEADAKEIAEHEFVADDLVAKLGALGEVRRERRQLLGLGPIAHFLSPIHVDLREEPDLDALIRLLHPTPALGALPRVREVLDRLRRYRGELGAPARFGAPFGVRVQGAFHAVVAIRHVSWRGREVSLPVGCGVIAASEFRKEWQELVLKRSAVKRLLGLES